ncbi:hypothetical protein B0H10DRAFT_1782550 [Mycena sp. CBHHK59/15]|nr:hypothetical protein B0H10DRAFT_1782550 [Mycena sp. CBHHK59/15]
MGILDGLTGDTVPFRWGYTHQRAFEDVKHLIEDAQNHCRRVLDYQPEAPWRCVISVHLDSGHTLRSRSCSSHAPVTPVASGSFWSTSLPLACPAIRSERVFT